MNAVMLGTPRTVGQLARSFAALRSLGARFEDGILMAALVGMVALPLVEVVLRACLGVGIRDVAGQIQHLMLIVGTVGATVAAREHRLLAFGSQRSHDPNHSRGNPFAQGVSVGICAVLGWGALEFVRIERDVGQLLAYGLPVWLVQGFIPAAFGLIGARILLGGITRHPLQLVLRLLVAVGVILAARGLPLDAGTFRLISLGILLGATVLGAPVFVALGGAAVILIWSEGIPLASLALDHYSLVANPTIAAIPLFTLAGFLLAESAAPRRLIDVFDTWFGWIPGGAALVGVLACTFFTSFTGASGVTIVALGGLLMPLLIGSGCRRTSALGLITAGGSAGVLLMPALPLILYAIIAKVPIETMFLAGLLPASLMFVLAAWWGASQLRNRRRDNARFDLRRALRAAGTAKWDLMLPVIVFAGLFSGAMTPLEAAAATAAYAGFVTLWVHRDLDLREDLPRVLVQCGLLIGGILFILGVAMGLTNYLVDARLSQQAAHWVTSIVSSRWLFLLLLNGFLLLAGFFVDIFSAIVVIVPLIIPMGHAFGIDPVHLGVIFLANMELGYLTPPVGMNLFFASSRFEQPLLDVCRSVLPLFGLFAIGVLIITYVPWLSLAVPGLLR